MAGVINVLPNEPFWLSAATLFFLAAVVEQINDFDGIVARELITGEQLNC